MSGTRTMVVGLVAAGLLAACGTRLPDDAFVEAREGRATGGESASGPAGQGARPGATGTVNGATTTTAAGAAPGEGGQPGAEGGDPGAAGGESGGGPGGPAAPNQASDVGVTETAIRIGTIVAENGVLGDAFQPAVTGLRAWAEWINANGGIGGRSVELFTCDDREDRARTLECARRLVEQNQVFALIATNTRAMGGASQYLADQGVPVLGNPINNAFYRYPNFFTVYGAPYERDGAAVGDNGRLWWYSTVYRWFRENLGATKAAVFNYDIAESAQAGEFFHRGLELEGYEVTRYVVSFAAPSFDAAVADMQRKGVQVIVDAMDPGANRRLCDAMARRGFTVQAKVMTIPLMGASFGDQFNDSCRPVAFVPGDSRPFTDTSQPYIAAYQEAMGRYQRGKQLHQWGLEAWLMAKLLEEALLAMGPTPTRAGFVGYLEGLRNSDVGGLMTPTIQWVPNDPPFNAPTVQDCIGISRWDDEAGQWTYATPFPYCVNDAKQYFTEPAEQGN